MKRLYKGDGMSDQSRNRRYINAKCGGFCFFFQAEDGIRDYKVTGVQTCALPICVKATIDGKIHEATGVRTYRIECLDRAIFDAAQVNRADGCLGEFVPGIHFGRERSEERRVGKECRSRWSPYH